MRSRPSEKNRVTARRGIGCREVLDPDLLRHFDVVADKRLDLLDDLLYITPQSLSVDVRNTLSRLVERVMNTTIG
jgi:hypothetical protein